MSKWKAGRDSLSGWSLEECVRVYRACPAEKPLGGGARCFECPLRMVVWSSDFQDDYGANGELSACEMLYYVENPE